MAGATLKGRPANLAGELALAGWAEADLALALALREAALLAQQAQLAARTRTAARREAALAKLEASAMLLRQSLEAAARIRAMAVFGEPGAIAPFDEARHSVSQRGAAAGRPVRVKAPGVFRRVGRREEVLVKAEASPVRTAKAHG